MTLLLGLNSLAERRRIADGALKPLRDSLAADLTPLIGREPYVPAGKALLSRAGGRCDFDGSDLEFDPFSPHAHRCPACGRLNTGRWHDGWWLYPYHLWLAERAVHAATLHVLVGDIRNAQLARAILRAYARQYDGYPNRDNVLGPSRLFFSTYLESLWLLHICIAADLLGAGGDAETRDIVHERIARPSAEMIGSYHEGASNRQAWNAAAIVAAHRLTGKTCDDEPVAAALGDIEWLLANAVGDDGSWFEGDNYHQFAHRGLWYGITLGGAAGYVFQDSTIERFNAGFASPFRTALPDFTYPARKDSRYAVSLRQWRFAESCELGLARGDDATLRWALGRLYRDDVPREDTGRSHSSGEAERPTAATSLSRADLGWKALLFAREALPDLSGPEPASITIRSQGYTIHRRDAGTVYVALDWGQGGGGHGHADRLNVFFAHGRARWLDDLGTGSYVDPSLHWYRSTLAHNAPLVDGRSQQYSDGWLTGSTSGAEFEGVAARAEIAPGVVVMRTLVTAESYFVDEVQWAASRQIRFELPIHVNVAADGLAFRDTDLTGAGGLEDGFDFVRDARVAKVGAGTPVRISGDRDGQRVSGTVWISESAEWFTATGPAQPASTLLPFHLIRVHGTSGTIRTVWRWRGDGTIEFSDNEVAVGTELGIDRHIVTPGSWVARTHRGGVMRIEREAGPGVVQRESAPEPGGGAVIAGPSATTAQCELHRTTSHAGWFANLPVDERASWATFDLGEPHYRRTEDSWREAGEPRARAAIGADAYGIVVDVAVETPAPVFVPAGAVNPYDNESADINGHGVQLYCATAGGSGAWMVVPEAGSQSARVRPISGWGSLAPPFAEWRLVSGGFEISIRIPADARTDRFALGLIVNDASPGRVRRRGQLVLNGTDGEFAYLRGDRCDTTRMLSFTVA